MNKDAWKSEQKFFIDNVEGAFIKDFFWLALFSGNLPFVFVLSASHVKRMLQWLTHLVSLYEKQFGTIVVEDWSPNTISPFMPERPKKKGDEFK